MLPFKHLSANKGAKNVAAILTFIQDFTTSASKMAEEQDYGEIGHFIPQESECFQNYRKFDKLSRK